MKYYVFGYRPINSPFYFYIGQSSDPHDKFKRDIEQLPTEYGKYSGNKQVIARINKLDRQVALDIIAETYSQDAAYDVRNYVMYFCQKSILFNGNHLSKANFMSVRASIGRMIRNGQITITKTLKCFEDMPVPKQTSLENWPADKPLPEDWVAMGKWAVPKWVEAISPPLDFITGGKIYLMDGECWNLRTHEIEED